MHSSRGVYAIILIPKFPQYSTSGFDSLWMPFYLINCRHYRGLSIIFNMMFMKVTTPKAFTKPSYIKSPFVSMIQQKFLSEANEACTNQCNLALVL